MVRVRFIGWSSQSAAAMAAVTPFPASEAFAVRHEALPFSCCYMVPSKPAGFRLPG